MLSPHTSLLQTLRRIGQVGLLSLGLNLGLSAPTFAQLLPDEILAVDQDTGTEGRGALFRINPTTGARTVLVDFGVGDADKMGADPTGVAVEADGSILVVDPRTGTNGRGALFRIDPTTGARTVLVDFGVGDPGALGVSPTGVAVEADGSILVVDPGTGTNGRGALFRIDPTTGARTVLVDFGVGDPGALGVSPTGVAVEADGSILVVDLTTGTENRGALFRVNPTTGARTVLVDFGVGDADKLGANPTGVAVEADGSILVVDESSGSGFRGALFRVNPTTGARTVLVDFGVGDADKLGVHPTGVAVEADGSILVVDRSTGTEGRGALFRVNPTTDARTVLVDFGVGDPGALGVSPTGVAVVPQLCGNHVVGIGETCDDGNTINGDGCSSTCQSENHPPAATCQNVTLAADGSCQASVTAAQINNDSSDPDQDSLTFSLDQSGPFATGPHTVTLTVSDGQVSSSCTATVTVEDQTSPSLTCPNNPTATATSVNGAIVSFAPTANDNCGTVIPLCSPASGSTFPIGSTGVTCTATDGAGLENSCSFSVQVSPLAATNVSAKVEVKRGPLAVDDSLEAKLTFTLGAGNNGIAPLTEVVTYQSGTQSFTIPAGSFRVDNKGVFKFAGTLSGVQLTAKITPISAGRYEATLEAKPLDLTTFPSPTTVTVTIGNDQATATAPVTLK